ncbi:SDR family NAD(P)-dependent oxidoreductase [Pseudonocardia asaccharolytica]|uniref:Ketoacyl reductase n=1 Tax=Pseudonocardia asaccharolytica DSM 44247 = NBRC 16224 TaxID=1123024 RepID=A0A511CXM8_9PSEU|nr:SDR family NAD(P)-dependent oxidoreductase [Pseudonocardia asaccharolytica]GEL17320.1 ketoacyl reductase [Pseudonocardia asaccharolytica DSM 44247 = NBRC 16224]
MATATPPPTRPVALITGASRGLGFLLAREFAARGHDLVLCARSATGLDIARADLEREGIRVAAVPADIGVAAEAHRVVDAAVQRFGRLDVLVTNAGVIQTGPARTMTAPAYAEAMDVMFWGQVHPVLAAWEHLRGAGGRILAITSVGGKLPAPHLLPYVAAKHAAVGFAEGLRVEAGREGISVTVAVPGLMRTGSPRNALFTGDRERERAWFTVGDSLPLLSMNAERAARKLVRATLRGRPEIVLTVPAALAARLHGLAPSTMLRLLGAIDRLLPTGEATTPQPGHALGEPSRVVHALTGLTRAAALRTHQHDDPTPTR